MQRSHRDVATRTFYRRLQDVKNRTSSRWCKSDVFKTSLIRRLLPVFLRSPYFMRYLHNNSTMLIPNSKWSWICFLIFATNLTFVTVPDFFANEIFLYNYIFLYKLKNSLEACFLQCDSYISTDCLNKMRKKIKITWLIVPLIIHMLLSLLRWQDIESKASNRKFKNKKLMLQKYRNKTVLPEQ